MGGADGVDFGGEVGAVARGDALELVDGAFDVAEGNLLGQGKQGVKR